VLSTNLSVGSLTTGNRSSTLERVESPRESARETYGETYWYGPWRYGIKGLPRRSYVSLVRVRDFAPYGFFLKVWMESEMNGYEMRCCGWAISICCVGMWDV